MSKLFRWVADQWTRRTPRFWLLTGLALQVVSWASLISFDLIHVGDDVLDDRVPGFVFVIFFIAFWSGILILLAVGAGAIRRWGQERRARKASLDSN